MGRGFNRAGLLWVLLPSAYRKRLAKELELEELQKLNESWKTYLRSAEENRKKTNRAFLHESRVAHGPLPVFLTILSSLITGGLFFFHVAMHPGFSESLRLALFTPLILASLSFLSLRLLAPYRLRSLFLPWTDSSGILVFFFSWLGVVWVLATIRMEGPSHLFFRPSGLHLWILFFGAIFAPLLEEVFFRELIPSMAPGGSDGLFGHLISAILFAAAHLPDSVSMGFLYFLSGLFLSLIRLQTGRLFYPLAAHSLANGLLILMDLL